MSKPTPKQFAQAIYSVASSENDLDEIILELQSVWENLENSPLLLGHLQYAKFTLSHKEKSLKQVFRDFIQPKTYRIILFLIKNQALKNLDKIIEIIGEIKQLKQNILPAITYTPIPLENSQKTHLTAVLSEKTGKNVIIKEVIEPKIIGGIKINLNGFIIDGSIAAKINQLHNNIKNL